MTSKSRRWLRWGAFAGALAFLVLMGPASCARQTIVLGPAHRFPPPEALVLQTPPAAGAGDTVTQASMRNIMLHLDDDTYLHVHQLQGRMHDLRHTGIILLDDKNTLLLEISDAVLGMSADDLTRLLNRYVFGYPGAPLTDLRAELRGSQMLLSGTLHKGAALPFEMAANLGLTPDGRTIRVHPTSVRLCGADGLALLHALGLHLSDMIDLRGAKGVRAEGNDLLLDPFQILPPPRISGHLTAVRIEGGEMVQVFGDGAAPPAPPVASESWVYFRGGTLRFGKLFMVDADMEAIDSDASDPFDFYLDYYASQLVAGYHVTTARGGMVAYFPDFADLGTRAATRTPPAVPAHPVAHASAAPPAT